jgi:Flp pilus assembly CpaE family ATPase
MAEWVVFDLPLQLHPASECVLGRCDFVTVVTEADPLALHCAKDRLALLQRQGIPRDMVGVVVVNRTPSAMTMPIAQLEDRLGAAIVGVMPPAAEACLDALSSGTPLILARPDHLATEMLKKMVQGLV